MTPPAIYVHDVRDEREGFILCHDTTQKTGFETGVLFCSNNLWNTVNHRIGLWELICNYECLGGGLFEGGLIRRFTLFDIKVKRGLSRSQVVVGEGL